jgi:hypothetical protein
MQDMTQVTGLVPSSPALSQHEPSCMPESMTVAMLMVTTILLAWTADRLIPRVKKTPSSSANICRGSQLIMVQKDGSNTLNGQEASRPAAPQAALDPQVALGQGEQLGSLALVARQGRARLL